MSGTLVQRDGAGLGAENSAPQVGRAVRSPWARKLLTFAVVMGPGLIVMVADNDAGAISTYTEAGAKYGTHLLWVLILLLPCTYFVQEMVARLGVVTGLGHAAMVDKWFGPKWGVFSLVSLLFINFLTLVTEFACIHLATKALGISPYITVPVAAFGLMAIVVTASYRRWERVTLLLCAMNIAWVVLAFALGPSAKEVATRSVVPSLPASGLTADYVFLVVAIVGTTIAPWQLFFQQSCIADKKLRFADLKWARLDTLVGAFAVIIMASCMMLVGSAGHKLGLPYQNPAQMAASLGGNYASWVKPAVLLLMVNAAVVGATTISLSSSWAYGEVKGWPHSLEKSPKEAPGFYVVYALCVFGAAGLVLIPRAPLQLIILAVQVLAGVMLPQVLIPLQLMLNDKKLMGREYVNRPWNNWVNWAVIGVLLALSVVLAAEFVAPNLFPASVGTV